MTITQILASDNFITVNKELARKIGLHETILLAELCNIAQYKQCDYEEAEFSATIEDIEKETTLTRTQQDRAIKNLEDMGLAYKRVKGVPAKRYFILEISKIHSIILDSDTYKKREAKRFLSSL